MKQKDLSGVGGTSAPCRPVWNDIETDWEKGKVDSGIAFHIPDTKPGRTIDFEDEKCRSWPKRLVARSLMKTAVMMILLRFIMESVLLIKSGVACHYQDLEQEHGRNRLRRGQERVMAELRC